MKYLILTIFLIVGCKDDSLKLCENYCNSSGEEYSEVLQMSYGTCICKNEEGENVAEGYHEFLNNQCEGKPKE